MSEASKAGKGAARGKNEKKRTGVASRCRTLLVLLRTLDFILGTMMCFKYRVMISSVLLRAFWLKFEA